MSYVPRHAEASSSQKGFHIGDGVLAAPKGAFVWGIVGLAITTGMGLALVYFADWTKTTFVVDQWIHGYANTYFDWAAIVLDGIDRYIVVAIILLGVGIIITFWRGWLPALGFIVVAGVGWVLIAIVKEIVKEPRPETFFPDVHQSALSYPSGHTVFVAALTVALGAVLVGSQWRWPIVVLLSVLTVLTAVSRLYMGVHYPLDVVGGALGGVSGAFLVLGVWNFAIRRIQRPRK